MGPESISSTVLSVARVPGGGGTGGAQGPFETPKLEHIPVANLFQHLFNYLRLTVQSFAP